MLLERGGDLPSTEGRMEILQGEKSHARESTPRRNASASQSLHQKDRGEAGDLGAAQRTDGEVPVDPQTFAGTAATGHAYEHATELSAEPVQRTGEAVKRASPSLERQRHAKPTGAGDQPQSEVQHAELQR